MQNDIKKLVEILLDGAPLITVDNSKYLSKYTGYSIQHTSDYKTLYLRYFINNKEYSFTIYNVTLNGTRWECETEQEGIIVIELFTPKAISSMKELVQIKYPLSIDEAKEMMKEGFVVEDENGYTYFFFNDRYVTDKKEISFDELSHKDNNRRFKIATKQAMPLIRNTQ